MRFCLGATQTTLDQRHDAVAKIKKPKINAQNSRHQSPEVIEDILRKQTILHLMILSVLQRHVKIWLLSRDVLLCLSVTEQTCGDFVSYQQDGVNSCNFSDFWPRKCSGDTESTRVTSRWGIDCYQQHYHAKRARLHISCATIDGVSNSTVSGACGLLAAA